MPGHLPAKIDDTLHDHVQLIASLIQAAKWLTMKTYFLKLNFN